MKQYELLLILIDEAAFPKIKEKYFNKFGIKVVKEDIWGIRKLAYPIKKQEAGFYICLEITISHGKLAEFRKQMELEDLVLRSAVFVD
ncbi:MAG: 30S ribosomal protein S6 [bacterium]